MSISISIDTKQVERALASAKKQIPFATAQALNAVAFSVQRAEKANIQSVLTHPRPFTANSVLVTKATKATQTATVFIKPEVARYLEPFEVGGAHVLPGKALLNPKNIRLDQYGQLTRNTMQRLLARPNVFVGTVRGVTGVWQRLAITKAARTRASRMGQAVAGHLKLLIRFGDDLPVHKKLGFGVLGLKVVTAEFGAAFSTALKKALSTAR